MKWFEPFSFIMGQELYIWIYNGTFEVKLWIQSKACIVPFDSRCYLKTKPYMLTDPKKKEKSLTASVLKQDQNTQGWKEHLIQSHNTKLVHNFRGEKTKTNQATDNTLTSNDRNKMWFSFQLVNFLRKTQNCYMLSNMFIDENGLPPNCILFA